MSAKDEPLAAGSLEREVRAALEVLSGALVTATPTGGPSLASGESGLALAHAYLHPLFPDDGHDDAAHDRLARAMETVGEEATHPGLHNGFAGVAWVLEHLRESSDGDDAGLAAEEALAELLRDGTWDGPYDLISGVVGAGVLALERMPRDGAGAMLAAVVGELARRATTAPEGITWTSDPEWLPAGVRGQRTAPYQDLGVAHGVPGAIAILAAARAHGVAVDEATRLLDGAVSWLLAQRLEGDARSSFANDVRPGAPAVPARTAWCYGDAGIASALLQAARARGDARWEAAAIDVARRAAARDVAAAGVIDAGLCHGAAGLAHTFHRLYRATGDAALGDAARRWLAVTLGMRAESGGVGGFVSLDPVEGRRIDDPAYLTGAAGIALALAAAITVGDAAWDRPLLLSAAGA